MYSYMFVDQKKFDSYFSDRLTFSRGCDHNCVIHRPNRARWTLNMESLYLINEEVFLEKAVVELVYKFDKKSSVSIVF